MKWLIFAVALYLAVAVQTSDVIERLLALHRLGHVYPDLCAVLVVFVALFAPRPVAIWAAWSAGALLDLATPRPTLLIGPHALGYVAAALLVLTLRSMVFRQRLVTLALLTLIFAAAAGVAETIVLAVRGLLASEGDPSSHFRPLAALAHRLGVAVYSALAAIPLGWILLKTHAWWGFERR